jgi:ribosome biogenesis protein UTP30
LVKVHKGKKVTKNSQDEKKSNLFGQEETPVNLQICGIKLPKASRRHLLKVTLPHPPITDIKDICLIVKDLEKGLKVDHEATINHFKALLADKGVEVASVISLRELKVEYKPYEAKTALCHRHEIFLADERIVRLLPKFLGKPFYKRKRFPMPVDLTAKDLSKEVDKVIRTVMLPLSHNGTCSMLRVGHTSMKSNHLIDNILQATEVLSKQYPGGWKNIRSIHLKTEESLAIPMHMSLTSANEIGFVDSNAPEKVKKEPITDELSTMLGAKVTVFPNFSIRFEGVDKEEMNEPLEEDSDKEDEDEDNDEEKKKADKKKKESNKKRKAEMIEKSSAKKSKKQQKNRKDTSDDEDDEAIEEAEHAYMKRVADEEEEIEAAEAAAKEEVEEEEAEDDDEEASEDESEEEEVIEEESDAEEDVPVIKPAKVSGTAKQKRK